MRKQPSRFSTDIADYVLAYGNHTVTTPGEYAAGCDAFVLETGFNRYEETTLEDLIKFVQYTQVMQKNEASYRKPVFFTDIPPNELFRTVGYVADGYVQSIPYVILFLAALCNPYLALGLSLPLLSMMTIPLCGYTKITDKAISYFRLTDFYSSAAYRSAVTAHKLEDFIAPEIEKRICRRPTIYIEYGAGHCDIEPYVKQSWLRDTVLGYHTITPSIITDKMYEHIVCELRPEDAALPDSLEKIILRTSEQFNREQSNPVTNWERIYYRI